MGVADVVPVLHEGGASGGHTPSRVTARIRSLTMHWPPPPPINITCGLVPAKDGATLAFRSSNFQTHEHLQIGRIYEPKLIYDNKSCLVDNPATFNWAPNSTTPRVLAQYLGEDGNILVIDQVIAPYAHPLASFPTTNMSVYLSTHHKLFTQLLTKTGLWPCIVDPTCHTCPDGHAWESKTVL